MRNGYRWLTSLKAELTGLRPMTFWEALEDLKDQVGKMKARDGDNKGRIIASMCGATEALAAAYGEDKS